MKLISPRVRKASKSGPSIEKIKKGLRVRGRRLPLKEDVANLPKMTASELKKGGWPGVMAQVIKTDAVVVTNHNRTEAVILTAGHYAALVKKASRPIRAAKVASTSPIYQDIALARLQTSFDQRLAKLKDGNSLVAVTSKRARRGKVSIGTSL